MDEMFSSVTAYEKYMGRWSARVAPRFAEFVRVAEPPDGGRVLDVGCGTGSMVGEVLEWIPSARVVGVDPSRPFLAYARSRFPGPRFSFHPGSAAALPYGDDRFDLCLSLLVFQLIPEFRTATAEMARVTRPGGTVAACAWDGAGLEMIAVLREEVRRLGLDGPAKPGIGGWRGDGEDLAALWRDTGLTAVAAAAIELPTEFASFDDYWEPLLGGAGPAGALVARLTAEQRDFLKDGLRSRLVGGRRDGPFALEARAWAVRGTVPR